LAGLTKLNSDPDQNDEGVVLSEINITPLTDIFLVLLIIFMVTSSVMSDMGVDVDLPGGGEASSAVEGDGVVVSLLPGGSIEIAGMKVPVGDWDVFNQALEKAFSETASRLVILEGDRKAFLGIAVEVMDRARKSGAEKFAIATQPE